MSAAAFRNVILGAYFLRKAIGLRGQTVLPVPIHRVPNLRCDSRSPRTMRGAELGGGTSGRDTGEYGNAEGGRNEKTRGSNPLWIKEYRVGYRWHIGVLVYRRVLSFPVHILAGESERFTAMSRRLFLIPQGDCWLWVASLRRVTVPLVTEVL